MTVTLARVFSDTYVDSVIALRSMRAMQGEPAVEWATAVMATPGRTRPQSSTAIVDMGSCLAGMGPGAGAAARTMRLE